jgi:vacuolar-type H+-ATPase subunit H
MSQQKATTGSSNSEADIVENIRRAELDSASTLEKARKEAELIVTEAKDQADKTIRSAEEDSRADKAKILANERKSIETQVVKIRNETSEEVDKLKQKSSPADLKQLVLSILEE